MPEWRNWHTRATQNRMSSGLVGSTPTSGTMELFLTYLIYFGAGILQDIVVVLYSQLIYEKKAMQTAVSSFVLTVINLTILYGIISSLDPANGVGLIIVYGLGNAIGAYVAVKFRKDKN